MNWTVEPGLELCGACGLTIAEDAPCPTCSRDDDDLHLDVTSGETAAAQQEGQHRRMLTEAVTGLLSGSLPLDMYYAKVTRVRLMAEVAVTLFKQEVVKARVAQLSAPQVELCHRTAEQAARLFQITDSMHKWRPELPLDIVSQGLQDAYQVWDHLLEIQQASHAYADWGNSPATPPAA